VGGPNFSLYVMQEVHYNNPELLADHVDSSGFRLFHTDRLRPFDIGILEVGLEYSAKNSIPPAQSHFRLDGVCASECTRAALPAGGITVVASQLHTHLTGTF
jgi:dopamine beta-monooxygenase